MHRGTVLLVAPLCLYYTPFSGLCQSLPACVAGFFIANFRAEMDKPSGCEIIRQSFKKAGVPRQNGIVQRQRGFSHTAVAAFCLLPLKIGQAFPLTPEIMGFHDLDPVGLPVAPGALIGQYLLCKNGLSRAVVFVKNVCGQGAASFVAVCSSSPIHPRT